MDANPLSPEDTTTGRASGVTPTTAPRPSSFRACQGKVPGGCDYGEACDLAVDDTLCEDGPCKSQQTGDSRCHRVCDDGRCGSGETCVRRTVSISDTGTRELALCLCTGKDCPERGPGGIPWPPEGGLALWRPERELPVDLYHHAAAASQERLFVSGGMRIQELRSSGASLEQNAKVFSAPFLADGRLGAWKESGTLPVPLFHHAMTVARGRLFVAGGQQLTGFTDAVTSAPIREDGTLGPWRQEAALPSPRAWHSLVSTVEDLWVVGGSLDANAFSQGTNQVWRASVSAAPEARASGWTVTKAPARLHYNQGVAVSNWRLHAVHGRGQLFSVSLGGEGEWREDPSPPWSGLVDFGASGHHTVRLVALQDLLLVLMPRGLTLTADLLPDGTVKDWRPASRLHGPIDGFATARSPQGSVYVLGGTKGQPVQERNREVWSTRPLRP
ncbi:hypothetical protein ACLESD_18705 [Pyxidicoccus sp. 3LFB2]